MSPTGSANGLIGAEKENDSNFFIIQQPPAFVFSDEWFEVGINLPSTQDFPVSCIELGANLHHYVEDSIVSEPAQDNNIIDLHLLVRGQNDGTSASDSRNATIANCKIKSPLSEGDTPIKYCLKFYCRSKQTGAILDKLHQVASTPVQIIKYKLRLFSEWENNVFYKDEGGKEKCLRARVKLCDKNGDIVLGKHLPLRLRLLYDDKDSNVVLKQHETLRVLGSMKHFIDPENGEAVIKFRIEDVSKNHQGLEFKLEVSTLRSADIAPGVSSGITVRSKRNKRQQSPSRRKLSHGDVPLPFEEAFPQFYTDTRSPGSTHDHDNSSMKRQDRRNIDPREAMNEIMMWSKDVAKLLPSLKWNLIGYCQSPDGSADYSKPNHIMPYPNDCISRILSKFNDINRCLYVVKNTMDQSIIPHRDVSNIRRVERTKLPAPPPLPGQFHGIKNDIEFSPQSPYYAPVTPQPLVQNYKNIRPQPLNSSLFQDSENRKRKRHESEVHWTATKTEDIGHQDEATKDVEYILAKHFRKLGFPVYNVMKEIIGFYRESNTEIGVGQFSPIAQHQNELDPLEISEAKRNLEEALAQKSQAVHCKKDWGSVVNMFDHAMVYDWSKDFNNA